MAEAVLAGTATIGAAGGVRARDAEAGADEVIEKPPELTWWDWAVFLLHTAAEIEHVLMVQYLYAAYSLRDRDFTGPEVPAHATARARRWRATITQIAGRRWRTC